MKKPGASCSQQTMEDSNMIRLPGHITHPSDEGLWKEICSWKIDGGKTSVK